MWCVYPHVYNLGNNRDISLRRTFFTSTIHQYLAVYLALSTTHAAIEGCPYLAYAAFVGGAPEVRNQQVSLVYCYNLFHLSSWSHETMGLLVVVPVGRPPNLFSDGPRKANMFG